jgi:hypothetical protein
MKAITTTPNEAFMTQVVCTLTHPVYGFLRNATLPICDPDTKESGTQGLRRTSKPLAKSSSTSALASPP